MNILCKLGMHGRKFASGGRFINLFYCPRCGRPDNNLCHQLLPIEQALWQFAEEQTGPEWDYDGKEAVVFRELRGYAGYGDDPTIDRFYYDTWGYRSSWIGDGMLSEAIHVLTFRKVRPSAFAEEAADWLAKNHPLAETNQP